MNSPSKGAWRALVVVVVVDAIALAAAYACMRWLHG